MGFVANLALLLTAIAYVDFFATSKYLLVDIEGHIMGKSNSNSEAIGKSYAGNKDGKNRNMNC